MKKFYLPPIISFFTALFVFNIFLYFDLINKESLLDIYSHKLQVPLFTGFLTISGFLLSLTTFSVIKMHEAVYQDEKYLEIVEAYKRLDKNYSHTKPLENLTAFLTVSVVSSLITSFLQFTVGNINNYHVTIFCLSFAVCSFGFVLTSCFVIRVNIKKLIEFTKKKKLKEV